MNELITFALEFFIIGAVFQCICILIGYVLFNLIESMSK